MTTHDHHPWNSSHDPLSEDPMDERCDAEDRRLDDALARTAPRHVPSGLVDRVQEASLAALAGGREATPAPLVFAGWARLAVAACIAAAIGLLFWLVGPDAHRGEPRSLDVVVLDDPGQSGPLDRFRGLALVSSLNYHDAVADLEMVLDGVARGASSHMVLAPGDTQSEDVENELDTVHAVSLYGG